MTEDRIVRVVTGNSPKLKGDQEDPVSDGLTIYIKRLTAYQKNRRSLDSVWGMKPGRHQFKRRILIFIFFRNSSENY
jgi:hypothetical protein